MTSFVPLDFSDHADRRVSIPHPCPAARDQHLIPLCVGECIHASADFPIVFVKDHNTGQMRITALVGLKPGESVFYTDLGWSATYIPLSIRPTTIALVPAPNDADKLVVCLDLDSPFLSTSSGELLFNEAGEKTEYLQYQIDLAQDMLAQSTLTDDFVRELLNLKLLKANTLTIQPSGQSKHELTGVYVVDEAAFDALSADVFQDLRIKGLLDVIYAIKASKFRLDNLLRLQTV